MTVQNPPGFSGLRSWPYRNLIPNAITFFGLFLSFQAILLAFEGDYVSAAWFVWFAGIIDLLDGPVARLVNAGGGLGKQLDSFADLVNCGVAPALLVYQIFLKDWGFAGMALSFCLLGFAVIRLGRFTATTAHRPDYFSGLPVTVVSSLIQGYIIFCHGTWGEYRYPGLVAVVIPVLCWLMVSKLRYPKSFFLAPQRILRTWQGWCALSMLLFIALFPTWIVVVPLAFIVLLGLLSVLQPQASTPNA